MQSLQVQGFLGPATDGSMRGAAVSHPFGGMSARGRYTLMFAAQRDRVIRDDSSFRIGIPKELTPPKN